MYRSSTQGFLKREPKKDRLISNGLPLVQALEFHYKEDPDLKMIPKDL